MGPAQTLSRDAYGGVVYRYARQLVTLLGRVQLPSSPRGREVVSDARPSQVRNFRMRVWFNGRISPCHGEDRGSIPLIRSRAS